MWVLRGGGRGRWGGRNSQVEGGGGGAEAGKGNRRLEVCVWHAARYAAGGSKKLSVAKAVPAAQCRAGLVHWRCSKKATASRSAYCTAAYRTVPHRTPHLLRQAGHDAREVLAELGQQRQRVRGCRDALAGLQAHVLEVPDLAGEGGREGTNSRDAWVDMDW